MTPERIAEIKARAAKATKGPWNVHGVDDTCVTSAEHDVCSTCSEAEAEREDGYNIEYERMEADANFIAHARQDIPDLIAALEAAQEREQQAMDALSGLALYLAVGSGDETTTPEEFNKRIRQGIGMAEGGIIRLAASTVERLSQSPNTTWGEVKSAILAISPVHS